MQQGKIPYSTLKRSIWKHTGAKRAEVLRGAGAGCDCAVFAGQDRTAFLTAQTALVWEDAWGFRAAFYRVMGDIAAGGGAAAAMELSIVLPLDAEEPFLRARMQEASELAKTEQIQIVGGHTMSAPGVSQPIMTITMFGKTLLQTEGSDRKEQAQIWKPKAGQALIATRAIGMEGTALLTLRNRERLAVHYTDDFLLGAEAWLQELSVAPEAAVAIRHGERAMHNGGEGGVFAALWEFAESAQLGLEVDLKAIPIRQESVEICEFLGKNPYELSSGGLLLIAAEDGEGLVSALHQEGIPAVVIGHFTKEKAKILQNDGEIRYLDLPKQDEVWKIIDGGQQL